MDPRLDNGRETASSPASKLADWIDRRVAITTVAWSLLLFAATVHRAETSPFWNDEIYTIIHARMPSIGAMWDASKEGFDLMPPLNAMLVHGIAAVFGEGRITTRMPAIVGYWLACLLVFEFVRRRAGASMGLMAVELFSITATYRFAYETRGYGLLLGFSALALFAWSQAAAGHRRAVMLVLMAVGLAAGVWAHYFGVLIFAVIGIAELVRDVQRRRLDLPIWAGVGAGILGFLPLMLLVGLVHRHTSAYWGSALRFTVPSVYAFIFAPVPDWGLPAALAVVAFIALLLLTLLEGRGKGSFEPRSPIAAHEVAAWIALAALPVIGLAVVRVVGSGLVPRYFLATAFATAGIPIAVGRLRIGSARRLVLLGIISAAWLAQLGRTFMPEHLGFKDPVRDDAALMTALGGRDPVAVANAVEYLQLWFYTPQPLRGQLIYLADDELSVRHLGSSTADTSLLALRRWCDVTVVPFEHFMTTTREFDVYAADNGWLMDELQARHVRLEPGPANAHRRLFRATVPGS